MGGTSPNGPMAQNADQAGIEKAEQINNASGGSGSNPDPASEINQLSDTHLKHVHDLLDLMSEGKWGRVFRRWREHEGAAKKYPAANYSVAGTGKEKEQLDDLHGIHWGQMQDAARRMTEQANKRAKLTGDVKKLTGDLDSAWSGKAANAALEKYHLLPPSIEKYCDAADRFAKELHKASLVPQRAIHGKADNILSNPKHNSSFWKHYQDDQSAEMLKDLAGMEEYVNTAKYGVEYYDIRDPKDAFKRSIRERALAAMAQKNGVSETHVLESETPGDLKGVKIRLTWSDLRQHGAPDCRDVSSPTPSPERIQWLDTFAGWYARDVDALRKRLDEAHKNISQTWLALTSAMEGLNTQPFGKGGPEAQRSGTPSTPQPSGNGQPAGNGGSVGGGPAGGGPSAGGPAAAGGPAGSGGGGTASAAAPPGGMPQTPEVPKPDTPRPPEMPQPEDAPTPGASTPGEAGPPVPGQQQGEQVTVGQGRNQVTVTEPGADGNVQLTVPGENGQPQRFEIGFGQQGAGGPQTLPGEVAGSPGQPGQQPGPVGQPGVAGPQVQPGQVPGPVGQPEQPGPGVPNAAPSNGPGGPVQVPVGPDGNAVIEVGERTITVEPTESGALRVSMDSGDGSPQNYTVDFDEDQGAGGQRPFVPPQDAQSAPAPPFDQAPGPPSDQPPTPRGAPDAGGPAPAAAQAAPGGGGVAGDAGLSGGPATASSYSPPAADSAVPTGGGVASGAPGMSGQISPDVPASTMPQGTGFSALSGFPGEGMSNSFASASGDLFAPADGGGQAPQPSGGHAFQSGATGLAGMDEARGTSSQGATGLASMGEAGGGASGDQSASARGGGGMMPMGGMGGAGGQQGGDQERTNDSPWRTHGGDLFDDGLDSNGFQHRAVLGDEREQ